MSYETILTDLNDGVLTITMNRPERLNAWTYQMGDELAEAIRTANDNDDVGAIVLTGAGRGFCAGADIGDIFKAQADTGEVTGSATGATSQWVELIRQSKPCIAAVNGACIGVGITQILPMDYIIASSEAKLSLRFVKLGVVPELASSHFLAARTGFGNASELMLTGRTVLGEEAKSLGLVDKVVAPEALLEAATTLARDIGSNPQKSLRYIKNLLTENMAETDINAIQAREGKALADCYKSPEHHEAINAFLEKRQPDFKAARQNKDQ